MAVASALGGQPLRMADYVRGTGFANGATAPPEVMDFREFRHGHPSQDVQPFVGDLRRQSLPHGQDELTEDDAPEEKDEADHQSRASVAEEESQAAPGLLQAIVDLARGTVMVQ